MTTEQPASINPVSPSAEPQIYVGIITSILVSAGLVTTGEATTLQPLLLAVIVALPTVLAIIQRQFATPNAKVAAAVQQAVAAATASTPPVVSAPVTPPPAPTTTSTGSTPVALTNNGTTELPEGTTGNIAANTDRWALDGTKESAVGPSIIALAAIDDLAGPINGHFYRTAMAHPYYVEMSAVSNVTSPAAAAPAPVAPPAAPAFDPNAPYPGNPAVTIAQAAAIDAQYQVAKLRPDAGPTSAALAAFDGAAARYGFNGVIGISIPGGQFLVVFVKGRIVGMEQGSGTTDTVALGRQYGLAGSDFGTVTP